MSVCLPASAPAEAKIAAIEERIAEWTHLPPEHGENMQVGKHALPSLRPVLLLVLLLVLLPLLLVLPAVLLVLLLVLPAYCWHCWYFCPSTGKIRGGRG